MKRSWISNRLRLLARLVEKPHLVKLRCQGVPLSIFEQIDKPWLRNQKIKTVLDIGANVGFFAKAAGVAFPGARIVSFEPLPDCFQKLKERLVEVPNAEALNFGLGERDDFLTFERNAYSPSSSFLPMTGIHKSAFPHAAQSESVKVAVKRLDDVADELKLIGPLLIKIDVQGYEDRVLRGGRKTVAKADVVIVETSFSPLYEGQPSFEQICSFMNELGFHYEGAVDQLLDPRDGRVLQGDSVFVKKTA